MTAVAQLDYAAPTTTTLPTTSRIISVDALRGFVMFTMIFVNDVAGVRRAPWWMKHYHPETANGMTFVDLVFPAFLFIVGLSIPLAFQRRLSRSRAERRDDTSRSSQQPAVNDRAVFFPEFKLLPHILLRTAALLLLGVFMVNESASSKRMHWPNGLWPLLVYIFGILAFLAPPRSRPWRAIVLALRFLALAGFVFLWWVYRDSKNHGMHTEWWGILGLIGWAYLVSSLVYLVFRRERAALVAAMALMIGLYICDKHGRFDNWRISNWLTLGEVFGSHASITTAGVILATVLLDATITLPRKWLWAATFGLACAVGAQLLYRSYGINKNDATPSWCLWASAITCWLWIIFSMLIDGAHLDRAFKFFTRGGENVLLAYMLIPIWYEAMGLLGWDWYWKLGNNVTIGILRALAAATITLMLSIFLKDRGIRVRL